MTDPGQEFIVTMTLGTNPLGAISTPVIGRRVMPTRGPETGSNPAAAIRRITMWLQGRPSRGHAARWQVEHLADVTGSTPSAGDHSGSVWGKACGCACG